MLTRTALALLLAGVALGQVHPPVEYQTLDSFSKVHCGPGLPKGFSCAVIFDVDPRLHDGIDIASVVGGEQDPVEGYAVIRSVSMILNDTLYTAISTTHL